MENTKYKKDLKSKRFVLSMTKRLILENSTTEYEYSCIYLLTPFVDIDFNTLIEQVQIVLHGHSTRVRLIGTTSRNR